MNVITVHGNYRKRQNRHDARPNVCRMEEARERCADQWHSRLELLMFFLIATASAWPLINAGEAVLRYL
jgi:hypothetical protein